MLFLLSLLFAAILAAPLAHDLAAAPIPHHPGLKFQPDKKLSITVFSDLHFGEPWAAQKRSNSDEQTLGVMNSILDNEYSDLVVLNGDLLSGEWIAPQEVNGLVDKLLAPLVSRNLPFAATFGNHDASQTCSTRAMSDHMWSGVKGSNGRKLSFTTQSVAGPDEQVGWSNYYIPIYSSSDSTKLAMLLWFFDSKGGKVFQPGQGDTQMADWVDEKVVSWFRTMRDQFRQQNGRVIPSLAFVHVPVQATTAFQQNPGSRSSTTEPGLNMDYIAHQSFCGTKCYTGNDASFMQALVETEGLMAVFSGHDHGVDWCMKWKTSLPTNPSNGNGVNFCFNRHSGYGGYSDWARGARKLVVQEDKDEVETWIRLENGSVSGRVMLNSTYGVDQYPEVKPLTSAQL